MAGVKEAAVRIAVSVENAEGRTDLYFAATGRRMRPQYERLNGQGRVAREAVPANPTFTILYPFRPSLASCADMVVEHRRTGKPIVYDEARWNEDPRIPEQAGPSITEDWQLAEQLAQQVAA